MIVTVENVSDVVLNDITDENGCPGAVSSDPYFKAFTGRVNPLPYPFNHVGKLEPTDTSALPMHPEDWGKPFVPWVPMTNRKKWNQLVQAGKVTLAFAVQGDLTDQEELFLTALV